MRAGLLIDRIIGHVLRGPALLARNGPALLARSGPALLARSRPAL